MTFQVRTIVVAGMTAATLVLGACTQQDRMEYTIQRDTVEGLPSVVATGYLQAEVKIQAIDYANRSIALTGKDGVTQIFQVESDVPRFNELKVGQEVKVRYNARLAMSVLKVGEEPNSRMFESHVPNEKTEKPGIECIRHGRIVANVESIDYATRVVKLKPVSGQVITLKASDKLKNLDRVHQGDQVAINYMESVVIAVD